MTCKRPSIIKRSMANRRQRRMSRPTLKRPLNTGTGQSCWLCRDPHYRYLKYRMHLMGSRKRDLENRSWRVEKETRQERLSHFGGLFAFFSMFLVLVFLVYYFSGSQPPANKRQTGKNLQKSQVTYAHLLPHNFKLFTKNLMRIVPPFFLISNARHMYCVTRLVLDYGDLCGPRIQ